MPITSSLLVLSLVAGFMSAILFAFSMFLEKNKKRSQKFLIWAVLFLAASFAAVEYSMWLEGNYLFDIVSNFNFPLMSYFVIWFAFIIWIFEARKERKIWIIFLAALITLYLAAIACPNCVRL